MSFDVGGFIYQDQSAFTHGLYELEFSQSLPTKTKISLFYNVVPGLFLGRNEARQANGETSDQDEKLTSHFGSIHLDQPLSRDVSLRLLGRYGLRDYNTVFKHRDTRFWTLGPHLEWRIKPNIELLAGYHYERECRHPLGLIASISRL